MAHVFITGANGYLGNVLVEMLLDHEHEVTAVDWMIFGDAPLEPLLNRPGFRLLRADVRALHPSMLLGVDAICDLAAVSNDPAGDLDPAITHSINHHARKELGQMAKAQGIRRYILASSCSVYGGAQTTDSTEQSPLNPLSEYAVCNRLAEEALMALNDASFQVVAFRNATIFGLSRRMRYDLAVNTMTLAAVENGRLTVNGDGSQSRPFIHVRDVARAMMMALEAPAGKVAGQIFNLSAENITIKELAGLIQEVLPVPVEIEFAPCDSDNRNYRVNPSKARDMLGFVPEVTVAEGIREVYHALCSGNALPNATTRTLDVYKQLIAKGRICRQPSAVLHVGSAAGAAKKRKRGNQGPLRQRRTLSSDQLMRHWALGPEIPGLP